MTDDYTCEVIRRLLAECFDYAFETLGIDPEEFIKIFCNARITKEIESGSPQYIFGVSGCELCELILTEAGIPFESKPYISIDRSSSYWCGDYLGYYVNCRNLSFSYIFAFVSVTDLLNMYPVYHEEDISNFSDELDRLKRNTPSRLSILRKKAKLSQSQLAVLSNVSVRTIQAYEQKAKDINKAEAAAVVRLSRVLNCEVGDILEQ